MCFEESPHSVDKILSDAIQGAIARGMPIDNLTSSKKDYEDRKGKLAKVVGRVSRGDAPRAKKVTERKDEGKKGPFQKQKDKETRFSSSSSSSSSSSYSSSSSSSSSRSSPSKPRAQSRPKATAARSR
jgi:hypothetical protein